MQGLGFRLRYIQILNRPLECRIYFKIYKLKRCLCGEALQVGHSFQSRSLGLYEPTWCTLSVHGTQLPIVSIVVPFLGGFPYRILKIKLV